LHKVKDRYHDFTAGQVPNDNGRVQSAAATVGGVPEIAVIKSGSSCSLIIKYKTKMLNLLSCFLPTGQEKQRKRMRTVSIEEIDAKSDFGTFIPISYPSKQRFRRFAKKNIPIRRHKKNMKKRNISATSVPRAQQISRQRRSEMFNLREKIIIPRTNNQIVRKTNDQAVPVVKNVYIDDRVKTYI